MSAQPSEPNAESELKDHLLVSARLAEELAKRLDVADLAAMVASLHDADRIGWVFRERAKKAKSSAAGRDMPSGRAGRARKVSVSMPEGLTSAVQSRVGRGEFSQYVTSAVTRQLELDLLAELSALLETDHGPVPEEFLAEAEAAWPDAV